VADQLEERRKVMSQALTFHSLAISRDKIAEFCRRWKITEFALFGSVLRDDFRPDSDIDVLVTFAPDASWRFYDLVSMKGELEAMFGRPVDLVEKRLVECSENYIRRKHILDHMETVYVA
jgi:predicted nucleotidyltransferase